MTANEVFLVELAGEEDESVELYDTCDEIRRKIDIHLTLTDQTKASFLRDIARAGWPRNPPKIQTKQLSDFQAKDGPTSGCFSRVYYGERPAFVDWSGLEKLDLIHGMTSGAYCYFEKKRIAEGKDKSVHRRCMEEEWPNGMVREREQLYLVPEDMELYMNEFGKHVLY